MKLAKVLDVKQLLTLWLRNRIVNEAEGEEVGLKTLKMAEKKIINFNQN
ncbi:hypothetical protein [Tenacibaculum sp. UWU-22]